MIHPHADDVNALEQHLIKVLQELQKHIPGGIEPWITFNRFNGEAYEVLTVFDLDSESLQLTIDELLND